MKRVLVFFNDESVTTLTVLSGVKTIRRQYPNGKEIYLEILTARFPTLTGTRVVYVASDRELTSEEIFAASENSNTH